MILWPRRFSNIAIINIINSTSSFVKKKVLLHQAGMTIRSLSTSGRFLNNASKRIKLSGNDYEELNELLSDSDGWEEDQYHNKVGGIIPQVSKQTQTRKVRNDLSDEDDSLICEMFEPKNKINNIEKVLAGASSKSLQALPPRNSFSSHVSNEEHKPIVESTQQIGLCEDQDNELLVSILKGEEQTHSEMKKGEQRETNCEPKLEELFDDKKDVCETNNLIEDENSFEIVQERQKVQYAEKFALLTQRPGLQDLQELESKLKLQPNTKIIVPLRLSKEQEDVIRLAEARHNIFYTGSAGTGKSVLLREMIKVLKKMYGSEQVAVTASTGLAACNIGGVTLHSFAGVGLGNGEVTKLYRKVRRSRKHVKRWESISALVIDEISMLDGELLEKLDFIAQKIRKNHRPFGDIQLIFCGDFFQLPPVSKDPNKPTKFAFQSSVWKEGIEVTIMLEKVFRQQGDTKFIEMLNKMRLGQIDEETEMEFKKLNRPLPQDEIIPAELYSTRNEVERANNSRLSRLPGKVHLYHAIDGGALEDRELKDKLLQNFLAPKELQLKVGAQVMMIKNIDATLVNGSLGKVIDFIDPETYMFYETVVKNPDLSADELKRLTENPELLRETWAEGSGDEDTPVRQKNSKEAFCRCDPDESIAQLGETIFDFLRDLSTDDTETRDNLERKRKLLENIHESSTAKRKLPLVRFKTSDMSTRTILVEPEDWAIEDENEKPLVSRVQLPLMLAWSLSIHKSQGQTLPKVKVDLRRVFEKGQAYVALSRAVSREGLQVLNFDKTRIKAHQKVVDFYSTLVTADLAIKKLNITTNTARQGKQRRIDYAPNKPVAQKRSKQSKSRSGTPNPGAGNDRITEMLMHRKKEKPTPHDDVVELPFFKADADTKDLELINDA